MLIRIMSSMEAVCIDGTVIECDSMEPQKQGVMLKQKVKDKKQTIGFVPWWTLLYVIPEDVVHNIDNIENPEQLRGPMVGGETGGGSMGGGPMGGGESEQ